jgi:GntR family transcriptional regulator
VTIDPDSGIPVYRQLALILADRIERGEITRRLPSETTLMQEFGLALGTVRKAVGVLRDDGLVFTTPGVGTFVRQPLQGEGQARGQARYARSEPR